MKNDGDWMQESCRKADEAQKEKAKEKWPSSLVICVVVLVLTVVAVLFTGGIGAFLLMLLILLRK